VEGVDGAADGPKDETGIEFRALYQKASEEFIASSEMMFRTLLKEFHDHQMITSRMDTSGGEILGVPLSRDEMEGVLEDLVMG
jgi:origin recognition complex subunit 2